MPYDKEVLNKAKEIGFFERKIDAETLKVDERERERLAEKLRKHISSTTLSHEVTTHGEVELIEFPSKKSEIANVELTLWDRIILLIMSIFGIISEVEYKKSKAVKLVEQRLKKIKPYLLDFQRKYLSDNFGKLILSLYEQAKLIRSIMDQFMNNENIWRGIGVKKSSCEFLFEKISGIENSSEYKKISEDFIKKLAEKSSNLKTAIRELENEIQFLLKEIPKETISRVNSIFNDIIRLREFAYFDFETIVRKFTVSSELKRGSVNFRPVSPQGLITHLKDLETILLSLNITPYTVEYLKVMTEYLETVLAPLPEELKKAKEKLSVEFAEVLNRNINKISLTDVITVITNDPTHKPFVIKPNYSLYDEFVNVFRDRNIRLLTVLIEEKNNKLVEKYTKVLFGENPEIKEKGIYSNEVSKIFSKYGLPVFLYTKPITIVEEFLKTTWDTNLKDTINTIIVSGVFSEKSVQKMLSDLYSRVDPIKEKLNSFIKACEQGGEFYILLSRFISKPSILTMESNKKLVERKIIIMNSLAFEILSSCRDIFRGMAKIFSYIVDDIYAPFPKLLVNVHKIGGIHNRQMLDNVEKAVEKLNSLHSMINIFVEE